jgi:hypothetical protein
MGVSAFFNRARARRRRLLPPRAERPRGRGRSLYRHPLLMGNDQQSKSSTRTRTSTIGGRCLLTGNSQLTLTTALTLTTSLNAVTPPADPPTRSALGLAEMCRRWAYRRSSIILVVVLRPSRHLRADFKPTIKHRARARFGEAMPPDWQLATDTDNCPDTGNFFKRRHAPPPTRRPAPPWSGRKAVNKPINGRKEQTRKTKLILV